MHRLKRLLILTLTTLQALSQQLVDFSPSLFEGSTGSFQDSYISADCTTHVTSISFRRYGAMTLFNLCGVYGLKVNGLGDQVPNVYGGSALVTHTLTATQRVT